MDCKLLINISQGVCFVLSAQFASAAVAPVKDLKVAVHFDHSFYSLDIHSNNLVYSDGNRVFKIPARTCNQKVLKKITATYQVLAKQPNTRKPAAFTKYDVEVNENAKPRQQVPRGSKFGTWLREMPTKMAYWYGEAVISCRRK